MNTKKKHHSVLQNDEIDIAPALEHHHDKYSKLLLC